MIFSKYEEAIDFLFKICINIFSERSFADFIKKRILLIFFKNFLISRRKLALYIFVMDIQKERL
jgi:hypothetical protein